MSTTKEVRPITKTPREIVNRRKSVTIITGPPGAGKTTFVCNDPTLAGLEIFDSDLGNKALWRDCNEDCVLMTAAPGLEQKEFWLREGAKYGFSSPTLLVKDPGMHIAVQQMLARPGVLAGQHNRLTKTVQRWYRAYEPHPDEIRIAADADRASNKAVRTSTRTR